MKTKKKLVKNLEKHTLPNFNLILVFRAEQERGMKIMTGRNDF